MTTAPTATRTHPPATAWRHPNRLRFNAIPGRTRMLEMLHRKTWPHEPLAPVPSGSTAEPVYGSSGLPLLGRSLEALIDGAAFTQRQYDTYGPVSWNHLFGIRMVSALGPDAMQAVMSNADKAFSQTGWEYFIGPFFRRGLMLLDFEEHHLHRRIMQEAFTRPRLAGYLSHVDEIIAAEVAAWPARGRVHVYPTIKQLSLSLATEVFMGGNVAPANEAMLQRAFTDTVRAGTSIVRYPVPGNRWHRGLEGRRVLEDFFRARLPEKRASDGADLFAALCHVETDAGETFSDDDVVNHMIFLMMAAHDTSTTTTSCVLGALAAHPQWQDRVRAESMAVDGELTLETLDGLSSLDLVIKEALRMVAPVPSLARKTVKNTELLGHFVPAGTMVGVSPWFNHYFAEIWKEPERFDPERFAEPRREDKGHRLAWVPFGGGAHKCIGMVFGTQEVKTLVHHIVRRYRLDVPPGYHTVWDLTSLPVPVDGLPITLTPLA
jgi:cytochrome P450